MTTDVLVLNKQFYAVQIASWRRALTLLYLDHAHVVDQEYKTYRFEDWQALSKSMRDHPAGFVTTPSFRIAIPEVIALKIYEKMPIGEVKFTRRNIYEHYKYRCCYCGKKYPTSELNLDHVLPRSRGGGTNWNNIVTSCIPCNLRKGNKRPSQVGLQLRIKPSKPEWRGPSSLMFRSNFKFRRSWQRFIDTVYWNSELDGS